MAEPRVTDVHVHIQPFETVHPAAMEILKLGKDSLDHVMALREDPAKFLDHMDEEGIWRACLINYVAPEVIGFTDEVNAFVSAYAREDPERLLAFGGLDPRAADVRDRMETLLSTHEVRGIKIHPPHQLIHPNAYATEGVEGLRVVYSLAEEHGVPVMIHTGTSVFPNARVRYGHPLTLDDVAVDFPDLKIIMAHGGRPFWTEEAFFLLRRHKNLFLDISSIPPKRLLHYFPRLELVASQTLFGSDWPGPLVPGMRRNLEDFQTLPLSTDAQKAILETNALRLFP